MSDNRGSSPYTCTGRVQESYVWVALYPLLLTVCRIQSFWAISSLAKFFIPLLIGNNDEPLTGSGLLRIDSMLVCSLSLQLYDK